LTTPEAALAAAKPKLDEASQSLGKDLDHLPEASEVASLRAKLEREQGRAARLRQAAKGARERAKEKAKEEEQSKRRRQAFAKLEKRYEELDEAGDSDEEEEK